MSGELEYMTLSDWILHNMRVYNARNGFDDPALANALVLLSEHAWDQLMLLEINGEKFAKHLVEQCIEDPFTRDEEEWNSYMECVAEKLKPFIDELRDSLQNRSA